MWPRWSTCRWCTTGSGTRFRCRKSDNEPCPCVRCCSRRRCRRIRKTRQRPSCTFRTDQRCWLGPLCTFPRLDLAGGRSRTRHCRRCRSKLRRERYMSGPPNTETWTNTRLLLPVNRRNRSRTCSGAHTGYSSCTYSRSWLWRYRSARDRSPPLGAFRRCLLRRKSKEVYACKPWGRKERRTEC